MKRKYEVKILDELHTVVSDKTENEVMEIASIVDEHVKRILKSMKRPRFEKAVVMAALNIAEELFEVKSAANTERAGVDKEIGDLLGNVEQALKE